MLDKNSMLLFFLVSIILLVMSFIFTWNKENIKILTEQFVVAKQEIPETYNHVISPDLTPRSPYQIEKQQLENSSNLQKLSGFSNDFHFINHDSKNILIDNHQVLDIAASTI